MLVLLPLVLVFAVACGGGSSAPAPDPDPDPDPDPTPPTSVVYGSNPFLLRVQEAIPPATPTVTGGAPTSFSIDPALPPGFDFDTTTGQVSGTPDAPTGVQTHTVTATNADGAASGPFSYIVGMELPPQFESLRAGFQAESVVENPDALKAAKMALLPDGRILFIEVDAGQIRVIEADGSLLSTPYIDLSAFTLGATPVTIINGNHQGLFGLVAAPDFNTTGFVYVMLSVEEAGNTNPRSVVLRFTDNPMTNQAESMGVVLDNLPTNTINNGGALLFEGSGPNLFVSCGDVDNAANAQTGVGTTEAGKILRINPTVPATLPSSPAANQSGTFEWVRGVRNCYGMGRHPTNGETFFVDTEGMDGGTGFSMLDELNFVQETKNYQWGDDPGNPTIPGADIGFNVWESTAQTITPTALAWHTGSAFSTSNTDSLLMTSYNDHKIRQFVMAGSVGNPTTRVNLDSVTTFATFNIDPLGNQPLDIVVDAATDDIYVVLFSGIFKISAIPTGSP
jgi:glucose/arabinose dehydrogenase